MQLHSFKQLLELYAEHQNEILFVFDIDLVVSMSKDLAYHPLTVRKYQEVIMPMLKALDEEQEEFVYSLIAADLERALVEECFPEVLSSIRGKGHRTLALTAQLAIQQEGYDTIERRLSELKKLGVDFNTSFAHISPYWFQNVPETLFGIPHYCNGILFANSMFNPKGEVLKSFLHTVGYCPRKVVFVDDVLDNVHSVRDTLFVMGIECDAWHYVGIYNHPAPAVTSEEAVSKWKTKIDQALLMANGMRSLGSGR